MGSSSRTALGRLVIAWIPVLVFSVIGYEHVVANMAFIPIALMYGGTNFSTAQYIGRSMVPAAIGEFHWWGDLVGGILDLYVRMEGATPRQHKPVVAISFGATKVSGGHCEGDGTSGDERLTH